MTIKELVKHSTYINLLYSFDQVHSNTRVPTQINTNQHESTRINTSPTRVNTNQHKSGTSQHESTRVNTSQLDQETILIYCSLVGKVW